MNSRRHFGVVLFALTLAGTASAQLRINAPNDNSIVNSTFYLQAEAPQCESLPTQNMAYSIDAGDDVPVPDVQSLQTMVTIANTTGAVHTITVKAWNATGAECDRTVSVKIADSVMVSAPAQGARVTSPFFLQAEAPTCGGEQTTGMAYEMDILPSPQVDHGMGQPHAKGASSLRTSVTASIGQYILRVKARGDSGAYCETDINLNVDTTAGLVPPADALSYPHMEDDGTYSGTYAHCGGATGPHKNQWQTQPDCATVGTKTGTTSIVSTPTYGFQQDAREFSMTYDIGGGGVRWFDQAMPGQNPATHFQYDAYVNIVDSSNVGQLEMDINHAITSPTQKLYILAAQCNLMKGRWQVTVRGKGWVNTDAPCTRAQLASGVWHHLQILTHHDPDGGTGIYYDAVAIDGNVTPITSCIVPSTGAVIACASTSSNPGWAAVIGPNFQIDGAGPGGTATAYADDFTVFYW